MPDRAVLQPNGRYAIFSTVVDTFTTYNATREELVAEFLRDFNENAARDAGAKLERAHKRGSDCFYGDIKTIAVVHGNNEAERLKALLSEPVRAVACTCGITNGCHTDWCAVYRDAMANGTGFGFSARDADRVPPQADSIHFFRRDPVCCPLSIDDPIHNVPQMHGGHSLGVHGPCPRCGHNHGPLGDIPVRLVPPQAEAKKCYRFEECMRQAYPKDCTCYASPGDVATAIVNHATKPLIAPERRVDIIAFRNALERICEAYGVKLKGDTDASGDILIYDLKTTLPHGYEWSAFIEPGGQLEFTEYVLEDESGATKQ